MLREKYSHRAPFPSLDVFTLDTLAWALSAVGRYQEARTFSERALAEGTQDARLFYHASVIAAAVGQPDEAAHWFAQAATLWQMLLPSERQHLATACSTLVTLAGAYWLFERTVLP